MPVATPLTRAAETAVLRAIRPDRGAARTAAAAVSRAAERGQVWIGLTAVAAMAPQTRRTGIVGLAGWGAGSGAAFALKAMVGRHRPRVLGALGSAPSSSSMPSSHTAGAFGYATAATWGTPVFGLVAVPLAVAVGWSRAATGRHFPTDVAVGAVVGIGAGALVHVALRRRGRHNAGPGDQ